MINKTMSNDSSLFGVSRWYYKHTHPNGGNVCFTHGGIWTLILRFRLEAAGAALLLLVLLLVLLVVMMLMHLLGGPYAKLHC